MSEIMLKLRQIEQDILGTGKVDGPELERLRRELYAHGKIERPEADFMVELHKRVQHPTPAGSTPRRPPGCGGCSSPTASLRTRSASSYTNSRARRSTLVVSSRCCSERA
jgi:hypothetical protein